MANSPVLSIRLPAGDTALLAALVDAENAALTASGHSARAGRAGVVAAALRLLARERGVTAAEPGAPPVSRSARPKPAKPRRRAKGGRAPAAPKRRTTAKHNPGSEVISDGPTDDELRAAVKKAGEAGTSATSIWAAAGWNRSSGSRWLNERPTLRGSATQAMPPEVRAALVAELGRLGMFL